MTIAELIKTDCPTIDAVTWVEKARNLICSTGTMVVMDEGSPIGLICPDDLALKPFHLVIDCMQKRPSVSYNSRVEEVLSVMKTTSFNSLPVYEQNKLIGIVEHNALSSHISASLDVHKSAIQMVAHDLKNPLSSIKAMSRLLEYNIQNEGDKELLDYTQRACDHAMAIVGDLIESGNLENTPHKFERTALGSLIRSCISLFYKEYESKSISLTNNLTSKECFIMADRTKLKRAICNLLSNALKFTPAGGNVLVTGIIETNSYLLSIEDNGIGIPEDMIAVVFDKFTSAKRKGTSGETSTGLGMYITRQLIEMHKGKLWVESQVDKGTTITIRFPEVNVHSDFASLN